MDKKMKFKCPICGKWHDIILYDFDYWAALCDSNEEDSLNPYRFEVAHRPLSKVLELLDSMNIEVAEDTDKIRWRKVNEELVGEYYSSQKPFVKGKAIDYCACTDAQKRACAADLKKRRAGK